MFPGRGFAVTVFYKNNRIKRQERKFSTSLLSSRKPHKAGNPVSFLRLLDMLIPEYFDPRHLTYFVDMSNGYWSSDSQTVFTQSSLNANPKEYSKYSFMLHAVSHKW